MTINSVCGCRHKLSTSTILHGINSHLRNGAMRNFLLDVTQKRTGGKEAEMKQRSESCVQYEARRKQKQVPHQTKSIIDAILWNWPRIGWMAVVIIMIKSVTKMKASATKQQPKVPKIIKETKWRKENQRNVWHWVKTMAEHRSVWINCNRVRWLVSHDSIHCSGESISNINMYVLCHALGIQLLHSSMSSLTQTATHHRCKLVLWCHRTLSFVS